MINEFNHFEGNLSIFQPAIDITEKALGSERTDIITFVNTIKNHNNSSITIYYNLIEQYSFMTNTYRN